MVDARPSPSVTQEVWLRGPLDGFDPVVMPAAHALLQSAEDLERAAGSLTPEQVWTRPGGAASVGFHLKHIAGSIDRLLTYARGEQLDAALAMLLVAILWIVIADMLRVSWRVVKGLPVLPSSEAPAVALAEVRT